jgi:hypothetical protein
VRWISAPHTSPTPPCLCLVLNYQCLGQVLQLFLDSCLGSQAYEPQCQPLKNVTMPTSHGLCRALGKANGQDVPFAR